MNGRAFRCPGPVSRREALRWGVVTAGAGALHGLPSRPAVAGHAGSEKETAVILIWLPGGPPHMETYEMKPDAPADYRGEHPQDRPLTPN